VPVSGPISPALLEQIRAANDIVDVIGGAIPLKRNGANFVALCPFHREKTPSFNVSPQRQSFHCFGCHKGGDVITWVREYENLGFLDAVRRLAQRASIPLEFEQTPGYQQTRALKERLLALHEEITQRWQRCLANEGSAEPARAYLAGRHVPPEGVEAFRLGYAPDQWDDTVNWARSRGHDLEVLEQGGLVIRKEDSGRFYDRFRGRLIFPIADEQGRVIGFSGRVLDAEARTAKYVNSPETPIFTKGRVFFGLDKTKRALLDAQRAIVCEGQLDLIRCFTSGVRNVVAPQGTALTPEHARILKRYVEEVVLCFDADEAGRNAAERSFASLAEADMAVRVALIPAPHDPDSFIREFGGDAFQALVDSAAGYFDFLLERACGEHDPGTDRGRIAVVGVMAGPLFQAGNQVLTDTYVRKTALRLGVSPEAVRAEMNKRRPSQRVVQPAEPGGVPDDPSEALAARPDPLETWLIRIFLRHDDLVEWFVHHLDLQWVDNPLARELVEARFQSPDVPVTAMLGRLPHDSARSLASEILTEDRIIPEPSRQAADVLIRLRNRYLDRQIGERLSRVARAGGGDEDQVTVLREMESLRRAKREPLMPLPEV